jgi:hypothetical protein
MTSEDVEYYRGRIAAELELANSASDPYARRAHKELADNYEILCRLLCPFPFEPPQAPATVGDEIGFTTLIQTLAHPHSAELYHVHATPADPALFAQPFAPERPRLEVPLIDPALIRP